MERWGLFEISLKGKTDGNPFTDHFIRGTFIGESEEKTVDGFYDGSGVYIVRFMPSYEGEYRYRIFGSFSDTEYEGVFLAKKPSGDNHGAVRVKDTWHFCYDDGTPFFPLGTTCYVWHLQSERLNGTVYAEFPKMIKYLLKQDYGFTISVSCVLAFVIFILMMIPNIKLILLTHGE